MSAVNIRFKRFFNNAKIALYIVETSDFSESKKWEELGRLQLLKLRKDYEFLEARLAKKNKIIPPKLYGLPKKEREKQLQNKYVGYSGVDFSMCIHEWAKNLIADEAYPEKYPG